MNLKSLGFLILLSACSHYSFSQITFAADFKPAEARIRSNTIISLTFSDESSNSKSALYWMPAVLPFNIVAEYTKLDEKVCLRNKTRWEIPGSDAIIIQPTDLPQTNFSLLVEAGDSINIDISSKIVATGKGAEKINLAIELSRLYGVRKKETKSLIAPAVSVEDYKTWDKYFDDLTTILVNRIKANKDKLSPFAYSFFLTRTIQHIEHYRLMKVATVVSFSNKNLQNVLTNEDRCRIFDTALHKPTVQWLRNQPVYSGDAAGTFMYVDKKIDRDLRYDTTAMAALLKDWPAYYRRMLQEGKKIYHEDALKAFEAYTVGHAIKYHHGDRGVEKLLLEYYKTEKDSTFSGFVKRKEQGARYRSTKPGKPLPELDLKDLKGQKFDYTIVRGKIIIISFWDQKAGLPAKSSFLNQLKSEFKSDANICFLTILTTSDGETRKEIEKQYLAPNELVLYTARKPTMANPYPATTTLGVDQYPSFFLVNSDGTILMNPMFNKAPDKPEYLSAIIKKGVFERQDGPYVMIENGVKKAYYVDNGTVRSMEVRDKEELSVQTDDRDRFTFTLTNRVAIPPSIYPEAEKILALSDIEGNFDALRKLLQANHVMDEKMDWTFGKGHLVLIGDFFDRGNQVTECLWLIYSLEEKARLAGGQVHFILGNHEIMNLQGISKYVTRKYLKNASLLNTSYRNLFSANSELGKWLASKNIVEQIGDLIFTHGGLGSKFTALGLTIGQMNEMARPYYADSLVYNNSSQLVRALFDSKESPFWFRGYYNSSPISEAELDSILKKFKASKIITGHTIMDNEHVSSHYHGKVINTDVEHAKGSSAALLIENNIFYNVDMNGERKRLDFSAR